MLKFVYCVTDFWYNIKSIIISGFFLLTVLWIPIGTALRIHNINRHNKK